MTTTKSSIALITGGSRGLGRDMALRLAEKGIDVIFTYNTNKAKADEVVAEIQSLGQKAAAFQLDTSNIKAFSPFFEQVKTWLQAETGSPHFDFLINNAGTALHSPIATTTEEQFDEIVNIHFKGVYFLTQKALPLLNDGGRIINISSGLARFAMPGSAAYGSSKAAIEMFTRYLAKELGPRRIAANVVAPGAIETDFGGGRVRDDKGINDHVAS
ncbi:MAG TPA: SDR family NAD(P)-dependent oxidoreductase, partial [Flavilitoribacter sp.]|nr:SDR family NAD(P)-dependent oxidoreductase [Flavilitoribacter sp.]